MAMLRSISISGLIVSSLPLRLCTTARRRAATRRETSTQAAAVLLGGRWEKRGRAVASGPAIDSAESAWRSTPAGVTVSTVNSGEICPFFPNRRRQRPLLASRVRWMGSVLIQPKAARRPGRRGWSCAAGRGTKRTLVARRERAATLLALARFAGCVVAASSSGVALTPRGCRPPAQREAGGEGRAARRGAVHDLTIASILRKGLEPAPARAGPFPSVAAG